VCIIVKLTRLGRSMLSAVSTREVAPRLGRRRSSRKSSTVDRLFDSVRPTVQN
jgi:hypothetical protein